MLLTAANQQVMKFRGLYGCSVFGTAGSASGGTQPVPGPRNPDSPAAATQVWNDSSTLTAGSGTVTQRLAVGVAQTGGNGGWQAMEDDASIVLKPNGGAKGNMEIWSIFNAASVPIDITTEFCEG